MSDIKTLVSDIKSGKYDKTFSYVYCTNDVESIKERYLGAIKEFASLFGENREVELYSAPGRTEVSGNHTDHNFGCVVAASVNLDVIAIVSKNNDGVIRVKSKGYDMDTVDLSVLSPVKEEENTSASLIRGTAAIFKDMGFSIGGFDAYTTSNVLKGSGLSSSAAFEVLIGTILSKGFNEGKVDAVEIAKIAQKAENVFFGKPCGLMDQMASSVGSFVAIDFKDPSAPIIDKVPFDFASCGYSLCIVDTGGNHADLTGDYASVPAEMKSVAKLLGKEVLRSFSLDDILKNLKSIRESLGDRAALRAIHFINENKRAVKAKELLSAGDFEAFKEVILESGRSSFMYLQNVYTCKAPDEQGLSLALAVSESILSGKGAWRVHGGGFAGTIQAFVPNDMLSEYKEKIESVFGEGNCYVLKIRPVGGIKVTENI